jgi:hypothetical protein
MVNPSSRALEDDWLPVDGEGGDSGKSFLLADGPSVWTLLAGRGRAPSARHCCIAASLLGEREP